MPFQKSYICVPKVIFCYDLGHVVDLCYHLTGIAISFAKEAIINLTSQNRTLRNFLGALRILSSSGIPYNMMLYDGLHICPFMCIVHLSGKYTRAVRDSECPHAISSNILTLFLPILPPCIPLNYK